MLKFRRINGENPDRIGVFTGYIYFVALLWQREKDSNPHIRSQSPLCYLYTIPLCSEEQKLLYRICVVCQQFFLRNGVFFYTDRSAAVKYFFSGLYSTANSTRHSTMLGSM